ncbi:MAG: prepilin peptidase [Candidatus Aenigmarchaeota archaeon]|nr:prepilin peptidase [Candidatus Aenigmarchaeota archaeon]
MQLDFLRLFVFVLFFIRIIRTDLKTKEIYNKDLAFMSVTGLILFLLGGQFDLIPSLATNSFLALITGIILWKIRIWSAGDGKLFAVCSLYLPYKMYLPFFSTQIILMNVFIFAFLYWIAPTFFKTSKIEKFNAFKTSFAPKTVINLFLVLFGLFYFIGKLVYIFDFGLYASGYIISLTIALFAFGAVKKLFPSKITYIFLGLSFIRVFFDTSFMTINGIATILFTLFALLFAGFLGNLSMHISYTEKKLSEIKESDIPMGIMAKNNKTYDFEKFISKNFKDMNTLLTKGFGKEEITVAKKIKNIDGFIVKKIIPFAPLLFVSTIFTVFFGVDVIIYAASLIYEVFYEN